MTDTYQPTEVDDWVDEPAAPPAAAPPGAPPSPAAATVEDPGDWVSSPVTSRDVDQKTGAPFALRLEMARAQNPNEAKLVLDKFYGEGNYGQDQGGNWWVMQGGKPTAIFPSGVLAARGTLTENMPTIMQAIYEPFDLLRRATSGPVIKNTAAYVGAGATPMAGATAGGAGGASIAGPVGAVAGAGIGAAGGYGIDQLVKWYRGLYAQNPREFIKNTSKEASLNAVMTGMLPTARAIGRSAANAFREWTGVTPQSARMTANLVDEGAHPPIKSTAPEFKSWGDKQVLRNVVAGDPWEATNTQYIQNRFKDALRSSGVPNDEIETIIAQGANPAASPSHAAAGQALVQRSQQHAGQIQADIAANRQAAQIELRGMERAVREWSTGAGRNMETLGEDAAQAFINHRRAFGNTMGREYRSIDAMNGDEKIFDLEPAWKQARSIIDLADPGSVPPYLRQMMARYDDVLQARAAVPKIERQIATARKAGEDTAELEQSLVDARTRANGNMTTFSEGHEMRTNLRELMGPEVDLTRTPWVHKLDEVENALNNTFRAMETESGLPGQAAARLRAADGQYREGIRVFKDAQIGQLIREIKSGASVDPHAVADIILREGRTAAGRRIIQMLPPELRQNVARADMQNILHESSRRGPDGNRYLDGMALMDALDARKRSTLLGDLYTPKQINDLRDMARQLAALDGKISVESLPPGRLSEAVANAVNRTNQLDHFVNRNPIGKMASGTPEEVDRAARSLSRPGNEARTLEGLNFFGANSPEWQQVQKLALQNLVRKSIIQLPNGRITVSGEGLEKELRRYTEAQHEALFPRGLADDLREVARQSKFLFPPGIGSGDDLAQSLAAKNITLHTGIVLSHRRTFLADMRYLYTSSMGWLIDRPVVLRFLSDTFRKNPSEGRAMMAFIAKYMANAQLMGPGRGKPTPEVENGNAQ